MTRAKTIGASLILVGIVVLGLLALRLWPHPALRDSVLPSSAVYARDGALLRLALADDDQYRLWTPLTAIDARLVDAVQLYEDRWFYWHPGVNPVALVRAARSTYAGGSKQGASTLTMQLARRLYHIQSQSLAGKCRQIAAALWIEARYSKREILEAYLNLAPYGGNIEGVGAASLIYFHQRAAHLTLPQALALAVIPQNPNKRGGAARSGVPAQQSAARQRLWTLWRREHPEARSDDPDDSDRVAMFVTDQLPFRAPHATDWILRQHRGGEVWSSIDLRLQETLERIVGQYLQNNRWRGISNASAMIIDRPSGEVRALLGSADYFDPSINGQVNGTQAKRSPGSTLKPFIYALALDQGLLQPATILKDAPTAFGPFSPENFDGRFVGPISAQEALVRSRNVPAVAVSSRLNNPDLYEFLKRAGVSKLAPEKHYGLALTLGAGEVTMEELARLYLMLASGGELRALHYEVSDRQALRDPGVTGTRLLSPEAAFITLQMLDTNRRPDTGDPARPSVAWKTGTSWGFRDAWTAGVFGRYVMLVWIGNFDGSGNPAFVGIQSAAPLFFRVVDSLRSTGLDPGEAPQAYPRDVAKVEVCTESGDLPNLYCKDRSQTWFIPGKSPIRVSTLHRAVKIDARTGKSTCRDGPDVRTEIYEFWPSDMQRLFAEAGLPRRQAPQWLDCGAPLEKSDGPVIATPTLGTIYTLRVSRPVAIALRANEVASGETLYWFANDGWIGRSKPNEALGWTPERPGDYQLHVTDQRGLTDSREVRVELVP